MMIRTSKRTTVVYELILDQSEILDLLKNQIPARAKDIEVTFRVPGGGDWSGASINIDSDTPLTVKYTIETSEKK